MPHFAFPPFTFDSRSGVLTRNGRYLPMPRQTAMLLTILLERASEVVTRDEIQNYLWPEGEHLDHEHAINRAVNNLRMILRDSAKKTLYVETVPKRGYYFSAPVSRIGQSAEIETTVPPEPETISHLSRTESPGDIHTGLGLLPPVPQETVSASPIPGKLRALTAGHSARRRVRNLGLIVLPLLLLIIAAVATYTIRHRAKPMAAHGLTLGVAPFETQDADGALQAESLRLDLMDALSQLPGVQLRASHSLDTLKHNDASIREVSSLLNLDYLLIGSLQVQQKHCLLDFELLRGADAVHVASFQYSGTQEELANIRDRVQRDVFRTLALRGRSVQAIKGSTENSRAYADYLTARDLAYQRTGNTLAKSLAVYQTVVQEDPNFARAYAGMATAYLSHYSWTNSVSEIQSAKAAASKALELDPDLSEAHAILGNIAYRMDRNFTLGEQELRLASQSEPHQAVYHSWLAELLVLQGRFEESLQEIDQAHTDDPLWPQIYNVEIAVAGAARDYPRAVRAAKRYLEIGPESANARDSLGWAYFEENHFEDAINEWRQMALLEKDPVRLKLEEKGLAAFHHGGIQAYGRLRLETIAQVQKNHNSDALALRAAIDRHSNDFSSAEWHAYLGDHDLAIAELQKAVAEKNADPFDLAVNAMYDNLHQDPAFLDLLSQVGLKLPNHYLGPAKVN